MKQTLVNILTVVPCILVELQANHVLTVTQIKPKERAEAQKYAYG